MANNLYHTLYERDMSSAHTYYPPCPYQRLWWCWSHLKAKKRERKIPQACTFRHQIARGMAPTLPPSYSTKYQRFTHLSTKHTHISQITRNHTLCVTKLHVPAYMNKECIFRQCTPLHQLYWCVLMCIHVYCCVYLCVWQLYWWHEWVHKESAPSIEYSQTLWGGFFPIRQRRVNVAWAPKKSSDF